MSLNLYNLTLLRSGLTTHAIVGNFTGDKSQELLIARGITLEIQRVHQGGLETLLTLDVFCTVRSLASFRPNGILFNFYDLLDTMLIDI